MNTSTAANLAVRPVAHPPEDQLQESSFHRSAAQTPGNTGHILQDFSLLINMLHIAQGPERRATKRLDSLHVWKETQGKS